MSVPESSENKTLSAVLARLAHAEEGSVAHRYANLALTEEEVADLSLPVRQALLEQLDYRRKYQLLRKSDDAEALVRLLSPEDLLHTVAAAGRTDAMDLVLQATPGQLTGVMDLTCWSADHFSPDELLDWLAFGIQQDPEMAIRRTGEIPRDLLLLMMAHFIRVRRFEWSDDPNERDEDRLFSLEEMYPYEYMDEDNPRNERFTVFLQMLYKLDIELFREVMETLVWELPTSLEEDAYRAHADRMLDMGYPEYYDAIDILAPVDPQAEKRLFDGPAAPKPEVAHARRVPTYFTRILDASSFLSQAFRHLPEARAEALYDELVGLGNRILTARQAYARLSDAEAALEFARGGLSLGLEFLGDGLPERAASALQRFSMQRLFRIGHSLMLQLHRRAMAVSERQVKPLGPSALALLDPYDKDVLFALMQRPPLFVPMREGVAQAPRPFAALADLETAAARLARLRLTFDLPFRLLALEPSRVFTGPHPLDVEPLEPGVRLAKLVLTTLAHAVLGAEADYTPLSGEELTRWLPMAFASHPEGGYYLRDDYRRSMRTWLAPHLAGEEAAYREAIERFVEEAGQALNALGSELRALTPDAATPLSRLLLLGD